MWHITPLLMTPSKTNRMSIMVSNKNNAPGHKYRHKLVQAILQSNLPIAGTLLEPIKKSLFNFGLQ
jgi:hypothetical protein